MTMDSAPQVAMGQCAVTGKFVPEDELVTINGQRVCAEGKVILLDRLKSGESMPGELERPTVLRRFGCMFVDGIIFAVIGAIMGSVLGVSVSGTRPNQGGIGIVMMLIIYAVQFLYFGFMHGSRG